MKKRNTKTKQLVWDAFEENTRALCHDDIEYLLQGKLNRVTIYRILQSFCEDGLLHKVADPSGKLFYSKCHHCSHAAHHDNHIHFRCQRCECILCIDEELRPALPAGFSATSLSCMVEGYCPNCSA